MLCPDVVRLFDSMWIRTILTQTNQDGQPLPLDVQKMKSILVSHPAQKQDISALAPHQTLDLTLRAVAVVEPIIE